MKTKGLVVFLLLIFLVFPVISAVEFDLNPSYMQGETIIAKISGNFISPLTNSNIVFYQGHVRIPVDYGIQKINEDYYLYASLSGKTEGNYSVSIENSQYMKGAQVVSDNIVRNFSITNETADFSLTPGVVVSSGDFSLEIQNLNDNSITVTAAAPTSNASERDISIVADGGTLEKTASFYLVSGGIKKIYLTSGQGYPTFQTITLSSANLTYNVPVYIFAPSLPNQNSVSYSIQPQEVVYSFPTNSSIDKTFYIYNTGSAEIKNISLFISDSLQPFTNLSQTYIDSISPNSNLPVVLTFFSSGETEVSGTLNANVNGQTTLYSQISLKFLNGYIPVNQTQSASSLTCAQLNGKICSSGQTCDQDIIYAADNVCCPGNCLSSGGSSGGNSTGIIIAIVIFAIMALVVLLFYLRKYKKTKKPVNLLDIAKGKN